MIPAFLSSLKTQLYYELFMRNLEALSYNI